MELQEYIYRREFSMSAQEFQNEPADKFFTSMLIYGLIKEKEKAIEKHGS